MSATRMTLHRDRARPTHRVSSSTWALMLMIIGALTASGAVVGSTVAAFSDRAELGITAETQFDALLIHGDETVTGFGTDGIDAALTGDEPYVPGATAMATLRVGNNSSRVPLTLASTVSGEGDLSEATRISATVTREDGGVETVLGNPDSPADGVPLNDAATADLVLAARDAPPLLDGETWSGPDGSAATLRVYVHVLDLPELRDRESGALDLSIALTAISGA
ncbi:hypothetical protein [Leucobacter manosquensis]|uniref:Uncharacterized protein n=1 Tax=Leucobacter manosquensis TaxID=2810611 RepID=A0ABS5M1E1_9MICO|nr:hypothetical protein [Leucobacter manosquensis]MBS3181015.1 hypothetical protein [Leucobacter manosquensis]